MSNKNILLIVAVITMLTLSAGVAWADEETEIDISGSAVEWQHRPAPLEGEASIEGISVKTPLAPGYCPSSGGSTAYEYISGVNYTRYPTGTMAITVEIFIANPTGCTYGDPCPEYDNSPEYVNAWVDWDGDGVWEAHERVIDADLTGYHDLNYYGTMTTSAIVTIPPGSANTTWVRVNLGWAHDPNDPCELSWTWGDVFDEWVSTETDLPQIEDIIVTGPPGDESSPMTTFPVTLEAVTSSPAGFAITSISWSGEGIPAGATGSPYTYTPAAGTHGNKNVQCTIDYEKTETGETGVDTMTKGYKLFFEKLGDEDGDSEPNWFEHWKADGPVPDMATALYDAASPYYGYCTGAGQVYLTPSSAGQHYSSAIVLTTHFGTESFGGPAVKGIDCAAEIIAHELYHKWVDDQWESGGSFHGETDSDKDWKPSEACPPYTCYYRDQLPDFYETATSHTWNNHSDTYDLEHLKSGVYRYYGDQEYMAMRTGDGVSGNPAKDWANPGKQTTPAYDIDLSLATPKATGPVEGGFTGNNADEGNDTDGDGLYDYLTVSSEVKVVSGGVFNIVAILMDSAGDDVTFINEPIVLDPGIQTITLDFNGVSIWKHGVDGIFDVSMLLSDEYGNELDHQYYHTSAYKHQEFQEQSAEFADKFDEEAVDTDNDKLYNYLIVYAGVDVRTPGEYTVEGWLHDPFTYTMAMARKTTKLEEGFQYVPLHFDGPAIRQHRVNGPYIVMELELSDEDNNRVDFINEAYKTDDYSYTRFQRRGAELADSYESWGKDPNKNKFYDYLTVAVGLNIANPGRYTLIGDLYDKNGNKICQASAEKSFRERGYASLELDFSGKDIFKNGENGPYNLKQVLLIGENGIVDQQQNTHTTSGYKVGMFQPLVLLTDYYTDHGEDLDGDGLYDSLTVCAEVLASDHGECVMIARLVDKNGEEILWSDKSTHVDQNEPQTICLSFDGGYLYASMEDGPYYVSDVYVYQTGDPYVPDYAGMAYRTAAYSYLKFEKPGIITGKVTKVSGDPVPNAPVIIEGVDCDYTDSDGNYMLTILQDGAYTVKVDPSPSAGVTGDSAQISVKVGETVTHDFVLSSPMDLVKWSQPPDMKYGVNIRSTEVEPIVADDWKCEDPRPVTDVHFWGSYIGWEVNNREPVIAPPGVGLFIIRIYEDVPVGVDQRYSHPGKLLYEEKVEKFEEEYVAAIKHPDGSGYEHKFYYSLDLPEPFKQEEGTIYWISIAAVMPENSRYPWGWETSTVHWNDNACRHGYSNKYWEEILPSKLPSWYQEHYETVDMAFELTVKYEPPAPLEPIKWQQRPDMVRGINVISVVDVDNPESIGVADDWLCLDGSPVSDLHFWGSYPGWKEDAETPPGDPPGVEKFRIQIYSDAPSTTPDEFSRPDELLYEAWVDDLTETYVASILLPWEGYEHKYRYDLDLPEVFRQKRDRIYWLSIAAVPRDPEFPWGWESSMDRWNDFAVKGQYTDAANWWWDLIYHPWTERPIDMAFELTTSEGPIKWLQFPDMADGVNILSLPEDPVVADDWLCTDGKAVTEVHFWGSYLSREGEKHWEQENPGPPEKPLPQPPIVSEFKFSFHEDVPAGVDPEMPWSHPGALIREVWMAPDEVKERYWDSVPHTDVSGNIWWEHKFYYIASLKEPFEQEDGAIYWLDIGAKPRDDSMWSWGWETSKDHWNDNAVRGWEGGTWWEELGPEKRVDMAFALTTETEAAEHDLGDAPDTTNSWGASMTVYPGVQANFPTVYQAGSPPHGPIHLQPKALAFLGRSVTLENEADIGFDEDGVNNLDPPNNAPNLDGADDGVSMPLTLVHCQQNTFDYVVTVVNPLQRSIYANVWFDWNRDGDWDDTMKCPAGDLVVPVPEWAVQNQQLQLSGPGVFTFTTPPFLAWLSTIGVAPAATWMRITLSEQKWEPIAGVAGGGGSGPAGGYRYGETEDYYVRYVQPPENIKWVQLPDLTSNGIDIKVDDMRILADDFMCISPSLLTDVHFWGSWKHDKKGEIANIRLSIHSDDPVGIGGTDLENRFSKPDKLLWSRDFGPGEFKEVLYYEMPEDSGEWWWDPASGELIQGGDSQVWRYDIRIKPDHAFQQMGTEENPTIYWLDISVKTESDEHEFGWKTREWPDHFMDDAVWDRGSELPRIWKELRYPKDHPYHGLERDSIDMAFMLTFEALDWGDAPDGMTALSYPTLAMSNGARHAIVPGFHLGAPIRVSQESSRGVGDFDANILGYVSPYVTTNSTAGYYQYGTPYAASFNGPAPALTSNRSHLFLADTTDGLSLFVVHDKPVDGSGGNTRMHWTLAGDTAGVLALDDPGETVTVSGGGTIFDSSHGWAPCCTDGMAFGSLDGAWTMTGNFTNAISDTGMGEWHVYSSDNSSIALDLETGRRVRLDKHHPIDPEPDGQPDPNALGDDNDGNDDEDGVVFNTPLVPGQPATVTVTASAQGVLQAWIDFNTNMNWADPGEQIFVNQVLAPGSNALNFNVPATAAPGTTFARFRFSTARGLSFKGPAPDGEVEDYKVWIECKRSIDVEKKVLDPETGEWTDAITANVGDTVRFQFTIHNDGTCCDLTDIVAVDVLSESLKYADNATVNGVPWEPTFVGITSVAWEFPDWVLEPCQTTTIEFDAEVVECGIDENIVKVKAVCVNTGVVVTDEDTATVMAGKPELEWTWNSTTVEPNYNQVMMAPVACDLNDDGVPDVIFNTYKGSNYRNDGILRAISGADGSELFSVTNPAYRVLPGAEPALADIDGDGKPEIMVSKNTSEIICFEHDGSYKWTSATKVGRLAVAVADLNQDGTPEIIAGRTVFNDDGTVRWTGTSGSSYASAVADLDLDGKPEVVTGSAAYRYNGSIYWTSSYGGMPAIGNFDSDPYPEIVVVGGDNVSLKEHDGTLKWGPVPMPDGGGNGPPVVADIDGDGELEIGVGGRLHYVAFETNGSIKWMADIVDTSSRAAGSSAFDFDSDGSCEIIYSDHYFHRIYKGSDGTVLFNTSGPSGTLIEQPVIVDVDNDGHVEIVFAVNNYAFAGNTGIEVYGNDECWPTARCIWNQHTYHITNINDDATVPAVETNNWDLFNNYRAQSPHSCGEVDVTTVNITPPSQDVYPGSFIVNVTVDPAEPITGVQFNLSFNASLVSADSVTEGDLLSQDGASTYFSPGTIDNTTGTIAGVAGVITTPGATISSPGVFATIQMTAKSVGGTSPLDLSSVIVGDINGTAVSIMVNDGTVTITRCIGDVNGDGDVNVLDMILVGQHWGETGTPGWIPEDVNKDGEINVLDMIVIGQHWGACP